MTTTSGQRPSGAPAAGGKKGAVKPSGVDREAKPQPSPGSQQSPGAVVTPAANATPVVRARRVNMTIQSIDPWTVLRLSFLLSLAVAVITVVAGMLLWGLLSAGGVFISIDSTLEDVLGDGALTVTQYFGFGRVLSVALLVAAIDIILITALATIGAFLFNLAASLSGGLSMTVTDD